MEAKNGGSRRIARLLALGFLAWLAPSPSPGQIPVGSGTNQAHLLLQFDPAPTPPIWFVVSFSGESITSAEALERIRQSRPEFSFAAFNWGTAEEPNLFLSSITWQGRTRGSQEIYDASGKLIGGNYWGIFAAPDEGSASGMIPPAALGRLPRDSDWSPSQYGISQRILRNGYWDGFVYQFVSSVDWQYRLLPALPPPLLQSLVFTPAKSPQIRWGAAPGVAYIIQSTDHLSSPFVTRATRTASSFSEIWTDPDPLPPGRRFYRVGLQP